MTPISARGTLDVVLSVSWPFLGTSLLGIALQLRSKMTLVLRLAVLQPLQTWSWSDLSTLFLLSHDTFLAAKFSILANQ